MEAPWPALEFSPYDSADYLTSLEDVALYREAALEEAGEDPAFIGQVLGTAARSRNMSELARRVGMSREGLYEALSADGKPSFATIIKVAKALGLKIEFHPVSHTSAVGALGPSWCPPHRLGCLAAGIRGRCLAVG